VRQRTDRLTGNAYLWRNAGPVRRRRALPMNLQLSIAPILALLAGILILVRPRLLTYIVAIYLIVVGVLGLMGSNGVNWG
jgi:hypothetical protein